MNTISKNSLMYWLHKAYTTEEYLALNDGYWTYECDEDGMVTDGRRIDTPKPVDGCSWYRKGFLLLLLTTLLVVGGLAVSAIAAYLVVNFLAFLLGGWVVFSWVNVDLAMILFLVSSFMFGILLLTDTLEGKTPLIPKYVSKHFPKKDEDIEREKYWRKKAKQPSAIAQYYKAVKEKYCPVLTLEKEDD